MKQQTLLTPTSTMGFQPARWITTGLAAAALAISPTLAQSADDNESRPGTEANQTEWYDPSTWFDDEKGGNRDEINPRANTDTWKNKDAADRSNPSDTTVIYFWSAADRQWNRSNNQTSRQQGIDRTNQQTQQNRPDQNEARKLERQEVKRQEANQQQNADTDNENRWFNNDRAADADYRRQFDDKRQQKAGQNQPRRTDQSTIQGRIEGFRRVALDNNDRKSNSTLVKISLEQGESVIADLGPSTQLADLDLKKGDWVAVEGMRKQMQGTEVIKVERITVDGDTTRVDRSTVSTDSTPDTADRTREIKGTIADSREIQPEGTKDSHLFVRIDLENGRRAIVDFGPGTSMADLDLQDGSKISVSGKGSVVNGQPIILAREVRVDNERQNIQKPQNPKGQG